MPDTCFTCRSTSGEQRISPGPTIFTGQFWLVEHAYPTTVAGWLVLVLKRHAEALHDLTPEEFAELGVLQGRAVRLLHTVTGCAKEYSVCFAEMPGFFHIHFHIIPRAADLPQESRGGKIFAALKISPEQAIPADAIYRLCLEMQQRF